MSWPVVRLSEVATIDRKGVDPTEIASGTEYIGLEHIESGGRILGSQMVVNGELASTKYHFGPNHILYGKLRPYLAKIATPGFDGVCSTDILPINPGPRIDRKFLAYFLLQPSMVDFAASRSTGANLPRLSPKALAEFEIPLPPLEEQKRIAAILGQADSLRRLRQRAIDRLNTLGQAIFYEMFGITTQEPRSDVAQPRVACALGDQITLQRGKDITERQAIAGPVPVISSGGISFYHDKPLVEGPGVILGRKGSVGKVHYVEKDYWPHDTTLYVKEFNGNIPFFVYYFFLQFPISDYEASAANPSLNRNNLHPVKVWWPAIDEQLRFKERIELLKHHGEILEVSIKTLEDLFSSLQHRAFRGEL